MIPASGHCKLIKMPTRFGVLQWPSNTDEVGTLHVRRERTLHLDRCKNCSKLIFLKIDVKPHLEVTPFITITQQASPAVQQSAVMLWGVKQSSAWSSTPQAWIVLIALTLLKWGCSSPFRLPLVLTQERFLGLSLPLHSWFFRKLLIFLLSLISRNRNFPHDFMWAD